MATTPAARIPRRGNGNITDDGTRVYAYDVLNRLTTVKRKSDNAQVAAYAYDALGRRVQKLVTSGGIPGSVANTTYRYCYDGQQIIEEGLFPGGSYTTLRQFVWGQYIDELVQLKVPTTTTTPPLTAGTYYPLQDLLYRTTATTNSSGAIIEAYDFDAYGNTLMYSGPGVDGLWFTNDDITTLQPMCEYLFTGRQYDPETQIYWYRARYYHPGLGRFLGRDPRSYNSPLLDLYQYVMNRAVLGLDPGGLEIVVAPDRVTDTEKVINVLQAQKNGEWWGRTEYGPKYKGTKLAQSCAQRVKCTCPDKNGVPNKVHAYICKVTYKYEPDFNITVSIVDLVLDAQAKNTARDPAGLQRLVDAWNAHTRQHEKHHVDDLKLIYVPFSITESGEACTEFDALDSASDALSKEKENRIKALDAANQKAIDTFHAADNKIQDDLLHQIFKAWSKA